MYAYLPGITRMYADLHGLTRMYGYLPGLTCMYAYLIFVYSAVRRLRLDTISRKGLPKHLLLGEKLQYWGLDYKSRGNRPWTFIIVLWIPNSFTSFSRPYLLRFETMS